MSGHEVAAVVKQASALEVQRWGGVFKVVAEIGDERVTIATRPTAERAFAYATHAARHLG